jgi:hypothetical protein
MALHGLLVSLLVFLCLEAQAVAVVLPPNACQDLTLVVDALRLQKAASAYCSSVLRISTVTVDVTATTPSVSLTTTVTVTTSTSGVTVITAPATITVSPSVS